MKNVYLLVSEDKFLINNYLNNFLKDKSNFEIIKHDYIESSLSNILEDLNTYSLFSKQKIVIVKDCIFFSSEKDDTNTDELFKYLDNKNDDNILILTVNKLDERKKIVKELNKKVERIDLSISIFNYLKNRVDGYNISDKVLYFLIEYCINNNEKIVNELEKLKLYCYDKKEITIEDINLVVTKSIEANIFSLVDSIVLKKKLEAIEILDELINHNEELVKIIVMTANQFRLLLQVKILLEKRMSEKEISEYLAIHPYRVKLAKEKCTRYSKKELSECLLKLADLDINIKTGRIIKDTAFHMFVLDL